MWQVGSRVILPAGKRWQGVGTINSIHENSTTCAVKWDSGRLVHSAHSICTEHSNSLVHSQDWHVQSPRTGFQELTCIRGFKYTRLDRSLLLADLLIKKTGGTTPATTPAKAGESGSASAATPTVMQTPSSPDKSCIQVPLTLFDVVFKIDCIHIHLTVRKSGADVGKPCICVRNPCI